jgi:DNA processing protein
MNNHKDALLVLNAVCGLGPVRVKSLVEVFGSAAAVLAASHEALSGVAGIPEHAVSNLLNFEKEKFLSQEYDLLHRHRVEAVTIDDRRYPAELREIFDAPVVLYVKGNMDALKSFSVAIVGSRRASLYGLGIAKQFGAGLAELGIPVVSGMARGIDTAAHEGALQARGITVAVLGCGLEHVYPSENRQLSERIAEQGAVVSEFPMATLPASFNFPRRNRIISGLSRGVVVVEAALKSGALITSDFALEHGREVFAVPGQVNSPAAEGTNKLIKQGAKLTTSVEDILEELAPQLLSERPAKNSPDKAPSLKGDEQALWAALGDDPLDLDELLTKTGFDVTKASQTLLSLEFKKLIRQLPGRKFAKVRSNDNRG